MHIALIGTPDHIDTRFDAAQLDHVKRLGFDTVQLNIAWGHRGGDEPLNLEDVLGPIGQGAGERERRWMAEMQRRAAAVHAHGLRGLFHAGIPQLAPVGITDRAAVMNARRNNGERCFQLPEIQSGYQQLIGQLADALPTVEDLLIYTYDQDSWLCSEFGDCPRCRGVPLHERLPAFLAMMHAAWRAKRANGTFWWEPWEMSAGQCYAMIERMPVGGFGIMLHGTLAEVQIAHRGCDWFRNMARLAGRRGIPVIGELFLTSNHEEVANLLTVASPRLAWEGVATVRALPGVAGIKEYFGVLPDRWDPNMEVSTAAMRGATDLAAELQRLAAPFGPAAAELLAAWTAGDDAMETWPWDLCWRHRAVHSKWWWCHVAQGGAPLTGHLIDSPAWCATRRSHFMLTEDDPVHPWLVEDVVLRWRTAGRYFAAAVAAYDRAIALAPAGTPDLRPWRESAATMAQYARRLANWYESTNLCNQMRAELIAQGGWMERWAVRLAHILDEDVALAIDDQARACATLLRDAWRADPREFLCVYLHDRHPGRVDLPEVRS